MSPSVIRAESHCSLLARLRIHRFLMLQKIQFLNHKNAAFAEMVLDPGCPGGRPPI